MARFNGVVGYGNPVEDPPESGIWVDEIEEFEYFGDVVKNIRRLEEAETLNDNLKLNNSISIVANAYAMQNFAKIKYVNWMGVLWTVTSVDVRSPRLILSLGSVYNGPTP